jgi:DNA (cytosine-5)-methyltransferase 1
MHFYNEHDPYRAAVLRERIEDGFLPKGVVDERDIEIIPDEDFLGYTQVHLFAGIGGFPLGMRRAGFSEERRIVSGGFPCQDISNAGKRAGITGSRSRLWREMVRCVRVVRPEYVFVENVAALLNRGMGVVLGDLAEIGYDAIGDCVSAADVGAPHLRRRIWIVAHAREQERNRLSGFRRETMAPAGNPGEEIPDTAETRCDGRTREEHGLERWQRCTEKSASDGGTRRGIEDHRWAVEPDVGRVAHGIPKRVDRLAALGDAIVPQCVEEIIRRFFL